jgi:hypothetical protein
MAAGARGGAMPPMFSAATHRLLRRLERALSGPPEQGLHVCPACERPFCWPVDWESADDAHWRMWLRCAECRHQRMVVVHDAEAAAFDLQLDRHQAMIAAAADRLCRELMTAEAETFAAALAGDLIGADDFRR